MEILIVGIKINTVNNKRNGICVNRKPFMHIVLGWRAHYDHGLFKVQGPRINNGVEIRHRLPFSFFMCLFAYSSL